MSPDTNKVALGDKVVTEKANKVNITTEPCSARYHQKRWKCNRVNLPYRPYSVGNPSQVIFICIFCHLVLPRENNGATRAAWMSSWRMYKMSVEQLGVKFAS